jgi:hypothetical protein
MQIGAEAGDGATSTFACFLFGAYESSVLGLFNPVPILSTPAFSTDGITAITGTPALSGALAFGATLAFSIDFIWEEAAFDEVAFDGTAFDEVAPGPFGAVGAFGAVAFRSDTFTRFPTSLAPASFLLFIAASLLASEPGSNQGP